MPMYKVTIVELTANNEAEAKAKARLFLEMNRKEVDAIFRDSNSLFDRVHKLFQGLFNV